MKDCHTLERIDREAWLEIDLTLEETTLEEPDGI